MDVLWILALLLIGFGAYQLITGAIVFGIILIVVGLFVAGGPGILRR